MKEVTLYCDGACSKNPGPGGWGSILIYKGNEKELSGYCELTTNNQMEITEALNGLKALKEPCKVDIYTDSAYVCNAFLQNWIYGWLKNGWVNSKKEPVKNKELWHELYEMTLFHNVTWHKVKGHADNVYNNRCDKLATTEYKNKLNA